MKSIGNNALRTLALLGFVVIMSAPLSSMGGADALQDPTQSPVDISAASGGVNPTGPVLQSVMMSAGRKQAMISGQLLQVGEKFGGATLVRITDQAVSLRNEDGTVDVLHMHPAVEKKIRIQPRVQAAGARKTKRPADKKPVDETR